MRIIPFDEQTLELRCIDVHGPDIDPKMYAGQDSVVLKDLKTGNAIHVYHVGKPFDAILSYAGYVNTAAEALEAKPFLEEVMFEGRPYRVVVGVNPIDEVGEKLVSFDDVVRFAVVASLGGAMDDAGCDDKDKRAYTLSRFIDGYSLCWPSHATDDHQRDVAKCFNMMFYEKLGEYIDAQSEVHGIDINPVNVKFKVERDQQRILLTITDLAKNVGDVYVGDEMPIPQFF